VLLILSSILVGVAWPAILDQFSVKPNANEKEAASIGRNMDATRRAFGLTDVQYQPYTGSSTATEDQLKADTGTMSNIRLLDPNILSDTFTQRVGRENFYGFPAKLDIDRYTVGGTTQDYIVAAKEIKTETKLTKNQAGVKIKVRKKTVRNFKNPAKRLNSASGWRHPVRPWKREGDQVVALPRNEWTWVNQHSPKPGWFDDTMRGHRAEYEAAVRDAMNETAERIAHNT